MNVKTISQISSQTNKSISTCLNSHRTLIFGIWLNLYRFTPCPFYVPLSIVHELSILYVRLLWSVIFELYKIIYAFVPLYLFLIKRKNYPTVNSLCFTLWNNVLHTIICPWISLRRFNIENRPSSFWAGALKFDLDKVIFKKCAHFFFPTFFWDSYKKNHS